MINLMSWTSGDVTIFISGISNLSFFFFLVRLARDLSMIFPKNKLLVSLIFPIAFLFSMSLISAVIFMVSPTCFGLKLPF